MKSYNKFINERTSSDLITKSGKWVDVDPDLIDREFAEELANLIQIAYAPIGGHVTMGTAKDVSKNIPKKYDYWQVIDLNDDSVADITIFGKTTRYGIKFSGIGHDGTRESKKFYLNSLAVILKKRGYYIEVSDKLADILLDKFNVPVVTDVDEINKILNKPIVFYGKHPDGVSSGVGWYSRSIAGHDHIKIIVGRPK